MNLSDVARIWVIGHARRQQEEVALRNQLIEKRRMAGKASAAARLLKYGREGLADHLRRIAPAGGAARQATMSPEHRHKLAVAGAKAGWAKLSLFKATAKRMYAAGIAKRTIPHDQRVANGRKGAAKRWGNAPRQSN